MPDLKSVPEELEAELIDLFDTWHAVKQRNAQLTTYYNMKNLTKDLGVSIPPQLIGTNTVVGWASKAVKVMAVRSKFDGYVFGGSTLRELDRLVRDNRLRTLYSMACQSSLVHGVSAFTVMRGTARRPVKVRSYSANQFAVLWDKDEGRIGSGIVLADTDREGIATKYVMHTKDAVVTFWRTGGEKGGWAWQSKYEPHKMGRPMMEPLIFDADDDRPLGHSRITPEVMGIIDKAMRDVLRMEVGAEFFTAPQRYILGAEESLFDPSPLVGDDNTDDTDEEDEAPHTVDRNMMIRAYLGSFLSLTRDENGEIPSVGQFPAGDAHNFIAVFENDAQRFSGATNVPLGQLGVLSNTYTSSDALGAANDPLILEVESMNARNKETMEEIARMMLAVSRNASLDELDDEVLDVQASFSDPSMPTIAARADAWTKIGASDEALKGTRVWYEGLGMPQTTIDRIMAAKDQTDSIALLNSIAEQLAQGGSLD
ncbi:MAG: phage portal protein [Atopobiaceae bacterium]|nr:phage portal protein [Atopobiaceae bacterium]